MRKNIVSMLIGLSLALGSISLHGECHELAASNYTPVAGTTLMQSAYVTNNSSQEMLSTYTVIPTSVRRMMASNNVSVYEINGAYDSIADTSGVADGVTSIKIVKRGNTFSVTCFIDIYADNGPAGSEPAWTLVHEVGHVVDHYYGGGYAVSGTIYNCSDSVQWQSLYAKYRSYISTFDANSALNVYSSKEAFAESYAYYIYDGAAMSKNAPDMYQYFSTVSAWFDAAYPVQ